MVVVGADVHKRTHTFVAVDRAARELGHRTFEATTAGHQAAVRGSGTVRHRCGVGGGGLSSLVGPAGA
jgi:hypothetical protein